MLKNFSKIKLIKLFKDELKIKGSFNENKKHHRKPESKTIR